MSIIRPYKLSINLTQVENIFSFDGTCIRIVNIHEKHYDSLGDFVHTYTLM